MFHILTCLRVQAHVSQDRLDLANYETQLLLTLGGVPSLMDKHTRSLVPLFFEFAAPSVKPPRAKTIAWLTMLSKLTNPKAAFRSQDLHDLYATLLSHPDRPLQSLALTCLLTFKESHVLAVEQSLRMFLVDILVLCHTLISQNAKFLKQVPTKKQNKKHRMDFDVELKKNVAPDPNFYSANSFRFILFGLEIM
jgi:hypothetical protein